MLLSHELFQLLLHYSKYSFYHNDFIGKGLKFSSVVSSIKVAVGLRREREGRYLLFLDLLACWLEWGAESKQLCTQDR